MEQEGDFECELNFSAAEVFAQGCASFTNQHGRRIF